MPWVQSVQSVQPVILTRSIATFGFGDSCKDARDAFGVVYDVVQHSGGKSPRKKLHCEKDKKHASRYASKGKAVKLGFSFWNVFNNATSFGFNTMLRAFPGKHSAR